MLAGGNAEKRVVWWFRFESLRCYEIDRCLSCQNLISSFYLTKMNFTANIWIIFSKWWICPAGEGQVLIATHHGRQSSLIPLYPDHHATIQAGSNSRHGPVRDGQLTHYTLRRESSTRKARECETKTFPIGRLNYVRLILGRKVSPCPTAPCGRENLIPFNFLGRLRVRLRCVPSWWWKKFSTLPG